MQVDPARVQKILEDLEEAELERVPADFKTPFSVWDVILLVRIRDLTGYIYQLK